MEPYQVSLLICIILLGLEFTTGTFILLGVAAAFLVSSLVQFYFQDFHATRDLATLVVTSIISIFFIKAFFSR